MGGPEDFSHTASSMFERPHCAAPITRLALQVKQPLQNNEAIVLYLSNKLRSDVRDVHRVFATSPRNVQAILRRQICNAPLDPVKRPVCRFRGERQLFKALRRYDLELAIFTLARVWDVAHIKICKALNAAKKESIHNTDCRTNLCIDLQSLTDQMMKRRNSIQDKIILLPTSEKHTLAASWEFCLPMTFDDLPRLESLTGMLPGEASESSNYAGIGGGGGSDVISASLLGRLLLQHKKKMNLLVSTRTWATGSQGKPGDIIGVPRTVSHHGGHARYDGKPVAGTFRIVEGTKAEGRDLETIPLIHHNQIYMVLDQGESTKDIPEKDRANLKDQFNAVLTESEGSRSSKPDTVVIVNTGGSVLVNTVLSVDTGGDVFGSDGTGGTTPDQDFRVQEAISGLPLVQSQKDGLQERNLVTAVVAPGVDAPQDAPRKAKQAGGMVYRPTEQERQMFLEILSQYRMDGNDPQRFGKTTLALQECLHGKEGWTSINLPEHVVDTWENPWSSFVLIQKCMSDIIFMPTKTLLPLISPSHGSKM